MTQNKNGKTKWYDNDVVGSFIVVLIMFGIGGILLYFGVDNSTIVYVMVAIFIGFMVLSVLDIIHDAWKWLRTLRNSGKVME